MINFLEYLNVPLTVGTIIIGCILVMQVIVEFLEFKGKVVPEFMSIRKFFSRRKTKKKEYEETQKEIKSFLAEVKSHYSEDNITKRNSWMNWVNDRVDVYSKSIDRIVQALEANTNLTEEMFIQSSRDRIIDFATKVENKNTMVSREEFNRIFKVYDKYEKFLKERGLTNGEVDINYQIIKESYEEHLRNHTFIEDVRGYNK